MLGEQNEVVVQGWDSCDLTLLVVGGGGSGITGGGGSGYIQYQTQKVSLGSVMTLSAQVGSNGQASYLTFSNGDTITAQRGESDDNQYWGGDGYSGGGGGGGSEYYGGNGGTNGGSGKSGSEGGGGRGTGEDISGFTFSSWNIGPGEGGDVEYQREQFGGGGGGVLVDGANQVTCKNLTDLKGLTQNLFKKICLRF